MKHNSIIQHWVSETFDLLKSSNTVIVLVQEKAPGSCSMNFFFFKKKQKKVVMQLRKTARSILLLEGIGTWGGSLWSRPSDDETLYDVTMDLLHRKHIGKDWISVSKSLPVVMLEWLRGWITRISKKNLQRITESFGLPISSLLPPSTPAFGSYSQNRPF